MTPLEKVSSLQDAEPFFDKLSESMLNCDKWSSVLGRPTQMWEYLSSAVKDAAAAFFPIKRSAVWPFRFKIASDSSKSHRGSFSMPEIIRK